MDNFLLLNRADSDLKLSTWSAIPILATRGRETNITSDMCFLGRRLDITIYVFSAERTHITKEMCFLGKGTNFTREILCLFPRRKSIFLVICVPLMKKHVTSLVRCVPLSGKHISLK